MLHFVFLTGLHRTRQCIYFAAEIFITRTELKFIQELTRKRSLIKFAKNNTLLRDFGSYRFIRGTLVSVLGYFMLFVFAAIFLSSPFRGRWFCGNLFPRGSLIDFWVSKISKKKRIPGILRSMWIRLPIFFLLMGFMAYRIMNVIGAQNIFEKIGMVFVTMCLVTTAIAVLLGSYLSPRAWCSFCPMGTAQRLFGGKRYQLRFTEEKCIRCNKCEKVCPMQHKTRDNDIKPDCIKCGRCVTACPKGALKF
jgi:ferredoxin-type protein NapH